VYNLGTDEYTQVDDSLSWICQKMGVHPTRTYAGGERGWIGDSPFIFLDTKKVRSLGWKPKLSIRQGVEKTVDYLRENEWLFEERH
jgi:UDP-glucose 4-epimerase